MSDFNFLVLFFGFIFGACFGSFANVLIYRMPANISILGRSFCQRCQNTIPWHQNIPLISYFLLKGKCAKCHGTFSVRYPFVEFLMGFLFALTIYYYGLTWTTLEYLILIFGLVTASFIDFDHMILPDEFTLGGLALGLLGALLNPERNFIDALFGVLFGGGILWLVAYVYFIFSGRDGLGGGDIKLLAWLGAMLGWRSIPFIILTSSVVGSVVGLLYARKTEDGLKTMIPFGPFLAGGALLYIFGLKSVGQWYIDLFFPSL